MEVFLRTVLAKQCYDILQAQEAKQAALARSQAAQAAAFAAASSNDASAAELAAAVAAAVEEQKKARFLSDFNVSFLFCGSTLHLVRCDAFQQDSCVICRV